MEKLLLDSIPFLVFSVNRSYKYTAFNKVYAEYMKNRYGVTIETGHALTEYYADKKDWEELKQRLDRALNDEEFAEIESSGDINK